MPVIQQLKVEADTREALCCAIQIALTEHKSATHWAEREGSLVLYWCDAEGAPLPVPLEDADKVTTLAWDWLKKKAEYPSDCPDTDGSVEGGFTLTEGEFYAVCKITPAYIVYGK